MAKREKIGDVVFHIGDPRDDGGIEDMDDVYQVCLRETQDVRKRTYLWGADGGLCPRKNLFNQEYPVPFQYYPSTKGYMAYGVAIENMLAKALDKHGRLIKQDIRLVELQSELMPHLRISGKMDIIALDHEDQPALLEIKTCGPLPSKPKNNHRVQLETYAAVSGFNRCYLTYVSRKVSTGGARGKLDCITFPIEITPNVIFTRFYMAALSQHSMDCRRCPPVDPTFRKSHECIFCDFVDYCWPHDESPVQPFTAKGYNTAKHISINTADELAKQRPERWIKTLEGLLTEKTLAEVEPWYDTLKEEYEKAPNP